MENRASSPLRELAPAILLTAALFAWGPARTGFLADDWVLARSAAAAGGWWSSLTHHFSLWMPPLYRLTGEGRIGPGTWTAMGFFFHILNLCLFHRLLARGLGLDRFGRMLGAALFALSPAGIEAFSWKACFGYVAVTTPILLAAELSLRARREPALQPGAAIAALQLVACLVWTWGIVLTPAAAALLLPSRSPRILLRRAIALLPAFLAWTACAAAQRLLQDNVGYAVRPSLLSAGRWLFASPMWTFLPNLAEAKPILFAIAAAVNLGLAGLALRRPSTLPLLLAFAAAQTPYLLMGAPQSRYYYIIAPFALAFVCAGFDTLPRRGRVLLGALLLGVSAFWAATMAGLWRDASREAEALHREIAALAPADRSLVLVNLPDLYGARTVRWRPYFWLSGFELPGRPLIRYNLADDPHALEASRSPAGLDRAEILRRHEGETCLEIRATAGDGRGFRAFPLAP